MTNIGLYLIMDPIKIYIVILNSILIPVLIHLLNGIAIIKKLGKRLNNFESNVPQSVQLQLPTLQQRAAPVRLLPPPPPASLLKQTLKKL
jgi:hypothetical protein